MGDIFKIETETGSGAGVGCRETFTIPEDKIREIEERYRAILREGGRRLPQAGLQEEERVRFYIETLQGVIGALRPNIDFKQIIKHMRNNTGYGWTWLHLVDKKPCRGIIEAGDLFKERVGFITGRRIGLDAVITRMQELGYQYMGAYRWERRGLNLEELKIPAEIGRAFLVAFNPQIFTFLNLDCIEHYISRRGINKSPLTLYSVDFKPDVLQNEIKRLREALFPWLEQ